MLQRRAGRRLLVLSAPCLFPGRGRIPFPFTAGNSSRVCCHCLRFVVAISRVYVSGLHAGAALFQGCVHMYDPFPLQGNKAGLLG